MTSGDRLAVRSLRSVSRFPWRRPAAVTPRIILCGVPWSLTAFVAPGRPASSGAACSTMFMGGLGRALSPSSRLVNLLVTVTPLRMPTTPKRFFFSAVWSTGPVYVFLWPAGSSQLQSIGLAYHPGSSSNHGASWQHEKLRQGNGPGPPLPWLLGLTMQCTNKQHVTHLQAQHLPHLPSRCKVNTSSALVSNAR